MSDNEADMRVRYGHNSRTVGSTTFVLGNDRERLNLRRKLKVPTRMSQFKSVFGTDKQMYNFHIGGTQQAKNYD